MTLSPTQYVKAFTDFQEDLERKVANEVLRVYRGSGLGRPGVDVQLAKDVVSDALAGLVTTYGPGAESFGMFLFEEMTGEKAAPAVLDAPSALARSSAYGVITKYANPGKVLTGSMTRHIMNYGRGAIHASAAGVRDLAYARVPNYRAPLQRHGKGPCEFCIVLASRGPVYADTVTAGERGTGNEYHDDCYCVPTLMTKGNPERGDFGNPSEWPRGYTPDRLYEEIYDPSHDYLDTIEHVTRKIRAKDPSFPLGR